MNPLVSVIIPNYNHAKFLRERIDSVLCQDFQDFEVIFLDDCSTDNSRDIIEGYRNHPKVSGIVLNKVNSGGPFTQWAKGIELARGEYVWIAESDDVAASQLLGALVAEMEKNYNAVIAFAHSRLIDQDSRLLPFGWHDDDTHDIYVTDGYKFVMEKMLTSNYIYNASMAIFRKSAYQLVEHSYEQYSYCGDWAFWIELSLKGDVVEVCRLLNAYRQHRGQATVKSVKNGCKWLEMGSVLKHAADLLDLDERQRKCLRGRYTRRFVKEDIPNREEVLSRHPQLFAGTALDICYYEVGKHFGFLKS